MTHVIEKYKVTLGAGGLAASKCRNWFSHSLCFVKNGDKVWGDCLVYNFLLKHEDQNLFSRVYKKPLFCVGDGLMYTCNPNAGKAETEIMAAPWTDNHMACSY